MIILFLLMVVLCVCVLELSTIKKGWREEEGKEKGKESWGSTKNCLVELVVAMLSGLAECQDSCCSLLTTYLRRYRPMNPFLTISFRRELKGEKAA